MAGLERAAVAAFNSTAYLLPIAIVVGGLWLSNASAAGLGWTTIRAEGVELDVPEILVEGDRQILFDEGRKEVGTQYTSEDLRLSLRLYRVETIENPHRYLQQSVRNVPVSVTYKIDRGEFAVISGFADGGEIVFYTMCFDMGSRLRCVDFEYPREDKSHLDPVVTRVALSFKR